MNTFGRNLRLTTFGESHGPAIGGIIDGFPPNFKIDFEELQKFIDERRPGSSQMTTQRREPDKPEFLSGISGSGITLGTPIGFIVRNTDCRSSDYENIASSFRPSHADYSYFKKYGIREAGGGGRSSARETLNWVIAGGLANQWLKSQDIEIQSALTRVGSVEAIDPTLLFCQASNRISLTITEENRRRMEEKILEAKNSGDSIGGIVSCLIKGVPTGLGNPIADKLHARMAMAMMSINAAKGFEYGAGFNSAEMMGSQTADCFIPGDIVGGIKTSTNYSGGIQGGISNGMPIFFSVAFKPTPSISKELQSVDIKGHPIKIKINGRHDPCVALRAVPVVKAMAALVIADFLL